MITDTTYRANNTRTVTHPDGTTVSDTRLASLYSLVVEAEALLDYEFANGATLAHTAQELIASVSADLILGSVGDEWIHCPAENVRRAVRLLIASDVRAAVREIVDTMARPPVVVEVFGPIWNLPNAYELINAAI